MKHNKPSLKNSHYEIYRHAILDAFAKLNPKHQVHNPVMFVTEIGSLLTTVLWILALLGKGEAPTGFIGAIALWLWFTVIFANFSEAIAEGRGKAQAESLRKARQDTPAKKLQGNPATLESAKKVVSLVSSTKLMRNDLYLVEAGDILPADGEIVYGIASVDESAVTGESAPVVREAGGDRSAVTGGTRLLSDWLIVRVSANPSQGFLDQMISLVEGAKRQKTPNEIALSILLSSFTIVFFSCVYDSTAILTIQRASSWTGHTNQDNGIDSIIDLSDSYYYRRLAFSYWYCWYGSFDSAQCDCYVRSCG
ncbi:high-affinity K+ transport system, ATPase chain B [Anaerolinea thermolimosa]|nr:high-affinity K+ transport system, ATPase chain B [Anaerolinea thermolimosa]